MTVNKRYTLKEETYKNMVHSKIHPILYTNRNDMVHQKKIGSGDCYLVEQGSSPFLQKPPYFSLQMTHVKAREVTFQAFCLLLLAPVVELNINSFTDLGISPEMPNHLKIPYHNLIARLQCSII